MPIFTPDQVPELPRKPPLAAQGRASIEVNIKTTTPILGGGVKTRKVDTIDILRPASIRGHLRFWWRALEGHKQELDSPKKLYEAEARLWGCAGSEKCGGRSLVGIRVEINHRTEVKGGCPRPGRPSEDIDSDDPAFYALWLGQEQNNPEKPRYNPSKPYVAPAERYPQNIRARLTIDCPTGDRETVERALRAWILFGGIGGRTRRGVGSLTLTNADWLPEVRPIRMRNEDDCDPEEFAAQQQRRLNTLAQVLDGLLGEDYFQAAATVVHLFPLLRGARLIVGIEQDRRNRNLFHPFQRSEDAWHMALHWLRDFRQQPGFARDGTSYRDPGRSHWPEADKLRRLSDTHSNGHVPRHDATPAWPRAGFGLPIVGKFKDQGDPGPFELNWADTGGNVRGRMASPLIVKPLPVRGGYLACALWLTRADPPGQVGLVDTGNGDRLRADSRAPFGRLIAPGDTSRIKKPDGTQLLTPTTTLRDAFLDWVAAKPNVWRVS